eukprot:gene13974-biopygen8694
MSRQEALYGWRVKHGELGIATEQVRAMWWWEQWRRWDQQRIGAWEHLPSQLLCSGRDAAEQQWQQDGASATRQDVCWEPGGIPGEDNIFTGNKIWDVQAR